MAYTVTYNGIDLQTGLYVIIQRVLDEMYWDQVALAWVSTSSSDCQISLSEVSGSPGMYQATAGLTASNGGLYSISIYSAIGDLITRNENQYRSDQLSVLQIINEVQGQLRLPKSSLISEAHAQLLLSFINEVQTDYMMEIGTWDNLKIRGAFTVNAGISIYTINPVNSVRADQLNTLQIGTGDPIEQLNDTKFKQYQVLQNGVPGQPTRYRLYGRSGGGLIIEVTPEPDQTYTVDYELVQKPIRLTSATDVPILDQDTIILGVKYLAKKDQGDDFGAELGSFQAKLALQSGSQVDSSWGDVEFL